MHPYTPRCSFTLVDVTVDHPQEVPALPTAPAPLDFDDIEVLEHLVLAAVELIDDLDTATLPRPLLEHRSEVRRLADLAVPLLNDARARRDAFPTAAQAELAGMLASLDVGPARGTFVAGARPRVEAGMIVPAKSVEDHPRAPYFLTPVSNVASVGRLRRAVGFYPRSRGAWASVWIGDDEAELEVVLEQFAIEVGAAQKTGRR